MNTTPTLKDLQRYFIPLYAARWKALGIQLGLSFSALKILENDNQHQAFQCCVSMLDMWLQLDTTASWKKLFTATESLSAASWGDKGDYIANNFMCMCSS